MAATDNRNLMNPQEIANTIAPLLNLPVLRFRMPFRAESPFPLAGAAAVVRGKLGHQLKRVFCPLHGDQGKEDACPACKFAPRCPYVALFEPRDQDGVRRDATVPFVCAVDGPDPEARRMAIGESGAVRFALMGPAISEYREFSEAVFRSLGRMPLRPGPAELMDGGAVPLASLVLSPTSDKGQDTPESLVIHFVTPFQVKIKGRVIREDLRFGHLIQALMRRMRDLRRAFGSDLTPQPDGNRGADMGKADAGFYRTAASVEVTDRRIIMTREERISTRQDRRAVFMNGLTGAIRVRGPVQGFLPLLRAGEIVHAGKKVSAGNGRISVTVL